MDLEKKPYALTDRAGWFVAGRKVPSRRDEDGNVVPLVGHIFYLTDDEAKYELLNLTIEPAQDATVTETPAVETPAAEASTEAAGGKRKRSAD